MGGTGKPGHSDLATGATVSTGGMSRDAAMAGDLTQGTMVGEYRIDGQIGEGGMGRVYAATHPVIAKRAAVKVLHPELSVNREAVERFIDEARAVNTIGHPNIVDIFSFNTLPDGRCYFVMEFLSGQSLRDRLRQSQLPLADALRFIETIAVALEAAHEKGIVHRDLKPDNIYLVEFKGTAPQVKLLDFGIAKLLGNDGARAERTRTGNLLGTPAYMSPEQARGHQVDHRTDVYALGCVAYEMFTGWLPFPADNAADMIAKHLFEQPPSPATRNPHVPAELDGLVRAMLAKDPAHRPTLGQIRDTARRALALVSSPGFAPGYGAAGLGPTMTPASYMTPGQMTPGQMTPPHMTPPQLTPGAFGVSPQLTPGPGAMTAPAPKSKTALLAVLGVVVAVAIGLVVYVATSGGKGAAAAETDDTATTPDETTKPDDPAAANPDGTAAAKPDDPAAANPDGPAAANPDDPAAATPDDSAATTPDDPKTVAKPTRPKRPTRPRPTKPTKPTKPIDRDAPM